MWLSSLKRGVTSLFSADKIYWSCFFILLFVPEAVLGGVQVFPVELFINSPVRSATIHVSNPTDKRQEAWVDFKYGYPDVNDSGKFYIVYDTTSTTEPSAVPWMRAFPQRFTLGPKESQVVRIMVNAPVGAPRGEYWARVLVNSIDREARAAATPGTIRMRINLVSQVDIPFLYRLGAVSTGLSIRGAKTLVAQGGFSVVVDLLRTGNAAYWGMMNLRLKDNSGKIVGAKDQKIAVFKSLRYPVTFITTEIAPGTYTLDVTIVSRRPGIKPEFQLKSEPLQYSTSITIP